MVIVLAVLLAVVRGLSLGAIRQASAIIGFLCGFILGALIAPWIALRFPGAARAFIAVALISLFASLGAMGGRELGRVLKSSANHGTLGTLDRVGGAVSAALGTVIVCWMIAGLLASTTVWGLSGAIGSSRILTAVNSVMPPIPEVASKVQALLRTSQFPSVFAEVVAPNVPSAPLDSASEALSAAGDAGRSTFKVTAGGPCGSREGTAFVVAHDVFVTAAHVVAGAQHIVVDGRIGTLVLFDPSNDVAIFRAPVTAAPLQLTRTVPSHGKPAAVLGYPLDRSLTLTRATIAGTIDATGRDIYDSRLVDRSLVVVTADVRPGNSGSPLLVGAHVVGLIFSRSTSSAMTAYAVSAHTISTDLARVRARSVSTGACLDS